MISISNASNASYDIVEDDSDSVIDPALVTPSRTARRPAAEVNGHATSQHYEPDDDRTKRQRPQHASIGSPQCPNGKHIRTFPPQNRILPKKPLKESPFERWTREFWAPDRARALASGPASSNVYPGFIANGVVKPGKR